ncbi:hypothetical protein HNQ36_001093 [Afipia massiliensis]|jgi:hypothetical protein|uniref:Toxin-antitoxin system HicB family antitoxin n=1 Tax=Afipia massiliensis TaxID=211460 RepID=A0A840MRU2_9BRAD|nr:hypothetical protein [Afipia massiliensis]
MKRWKKPGRGSAHRRQEVRRIPVSFDDETFDEVRHLAEKAGISFAEQNRQLVEFGLEAVRADKRNRNAGR